MPQPRSNRAAWLPWALTPLAVAGFTALWLLAAFYSGRQCSWMAVLGALDLIWVLGLGRPTTPLRRAVGATVGTVVMIVLANWLLASTYAGSQVGLSPWEAALRLGGRHALTLAGLANAWQDAVWVAVALAVAACGPFLAARMQATAVR